MRMWIALLLFGAAFFLALGISLPIVEFQKLYFFKDAPSLVELFAGLWSEGSVIIALAVLLFSLVLPLLKLAIVFVTALAPETAIARSNAIGWAGVLSKWSMMDVLLVALVIFAAKSSGIADAFAQPGLWFYAASALCGATAAALIKKENGKAGAELGRQSASGVE